MLLLLYVIDKKHTCYGQTVTTDRTSVTDDGKPIYLMAISKVRVDLTPEQVSLHPPPELMN